MPTREQQPHEVYSVQSQLDLLEAQFAKELTPELAHGYIASLVECLGGPHQSLSTFTEKGRRLHHFIGKELYGPLLIGYVQWIESFAALYDYRGNVYFALRDASPLLAAAEVRWGPEFWWGSRIWTPVPVYANRPLLGIEDEIAPECSIADGQVRTYLENKGMVGKGKMIVWADTGAWGTVVKALKQTVCKDNYLWPLFWYSHNPHIPGYLNQRLQQMGVSEKYGEILNDSLECVFPQVYLRPLAVNADHSDVVLIPGPYLSQQWGAAALSGVTQAALIHKHLTVVVQLQALEKLIELSAKAKETGTWTGVLSTNTPTWSHGDDFLANWPEGLLP